MQALEIYRSRFKPSKQLERPYAMAGVNVYAADADAEARRQFTSLQQAFIALRRGTPGQVPPPVDDIGALWSEPERAMVEHALRYSFVGTAQTIERGLSEFLRDTRVDELMVTGLFHDHGARLRSFEIAAEVRTRLGP
jgi:alkanesulfonate monooxygenase SsuD/methylene tetrahydromethanopterin reductase-like flavin-dependent oxidoreductase (luciferase family)